MAKHIAIVGGGPAGLTAAYEIAEGDPEAEITLYQLGWRLGGKLATDRNSHTYRRIEEHGIHIFFGAYENTFHLLRRILGPSWLQLFQKHSHTTLMEEIDDEWEAWAIEFPEMPGEPGDALYAGEDGNLSMVEHGLRVLRWLAAFLSNQFSGNFFTALMNWASSSVLDAVIELVEAAGATPDATTVQDVDRLLGRLLKILAVFRWSGDVLWSFASFFGVDAKPRKARLRRIWIMAELCSAAAMGLLRAGSDGSTTEDLDDHELRAWLSSNVPFGSGLSDETRDSAPLRMVYEVVFAYDGGNTLVPRIAAGTSVRGLIRLLFDYRGAFVYKLKHGSEVFVTTLYEKLVANPKVHFEFFHRLVDVEVAADQIEALHFKRQATVTSPPYDPLDTDGGWPDHPNHDQLDEGSTLSQGDELACGHGYDLEALSTAADYAVSYPTVVRRRDPLVAGDEGFDDVVLAISVGAMLNSSIASGLKGDALQESDKSTSQRDFDTMLAHQQAVPTCSCQLWFSRSASTMGWPRDGDLVGTFAQPFGNWADLELVAASESWPDPQPLHIAYLAGPLLVPVPGVYAPDLWRNQVRDDVADWLANHSKHLWPDAHDPTTGFRWDWLLDVDGQTGPQRLDSQWFRANRNEGELYTLTPPGSTRHRLPAGASGFSNLYLAGDWTHCGFDVGAVEAAVMSGRQAAKALLGAGDEFIVYAEG